MKIPRGLIAVVRPRCLIAVGLIVFFAYLFANNLDPDAGRGASTRLPPGSLQALAESLST